MRELNQRQFGRYYHVAPDAYRESIGRHGLNHLLGQSEYQGIDFPRGNYVFTNRDAASTYQAIREREESDAYGFDARKYDVWEVQKPKGVKPQPDPFRDDESGLGRYSRYIAEPIEPSRLRRLT